MKISKKYMKGGKPKDKSIKGLTDREVWDSNKDGVQQKYGSFEEYQKAAQAWRNRNVDITKGEDTTPQEMETPAATEEGVSLRKSQRVERRKLRKKQKEERKENRIKKREVRKENKERKKWMKRMKKAWETGDFRGDEDVDRKYPSMESGGMSPEKESKRSWVGKFVDRSKSRYGRWKQKRKEKPMSEKEFYEPNVAKGGGSGYKAMTEYGNLGRGISALMTKKSKNPDSWTAKDEAELKRMQRIHKATKPGSKENVRDIYLEEQKTKQDKSQAEWDKKTAQWEKEDEEARKKRTEGSEKYKQTLTPGRKFVTGGVNDNEEDNNTEGKSPVKEEGRGNYYKGSDTPQVIRDKDIIRNRGKKQNNESSNTDEVTTASDTNKTTSADRVERRSNRKDYRRAMRKYRQEMRQYNRTMRRKAREERRENRGMTYTQGRRISPRRWWKNLRDRLGGRYVHEGRAKGYRDFRTSKTTKPVKPVKNFKDGGISGKSNKEMNEFLNKNRVAKSNKEVSKFLKQKKAANEMKEWRKMHEARKVDWEKIKGQKKPTKTQMGKLLKTGSGRTLLKRMGYLGLALSLFNMSKKVAPATKPALKKRAKKGNYNIGRKI